MAHLFLCNFALAYSIHAVYGLQNLMPTKRACHSWAVLLHDLAIPLKSGEKRWRNRDQMRLHWILFYRSDPNAGRPVNE